MTKFKKIQTNLSDVLPLVENKVVISGSYRDSDKNIVSGLIDKPVIAVPTSIGFGTGEKGYSALLTMLNSCAPGISVVNIDAGFSAGFQASLIARR